ncbi:hypothetical protein G3I44_08290 [Halogeometricum borinquense]|uniref:Uncharacterized protein n=1 Tax=Halogeometricum borinquense TaxID=60847 RepID=A0A6C0UJ04_9EURY|nr:hypothetical protein [Halogeometricum borinquense]QIB74281.1 hypothetical protein G3I44_08290 [Halogeometricum borinquense]
MIRDPRVLGDEVVPDHELVLHRRGEMDTLLSALRPRDHVDGPPRSPYSARRVARDCR